VLGWGKGSVEGVEARKGLVEGEESVLGGER